MNPTSDIGPHSADEPTRIDPDRDATPPTNWREALMALIASRIELIQLESKEVASSAVKCLVMIVAACISVIFAWAALVAGGVSLIADLGGWPWNLVAIAAALVHILAAVILAKLAKPSGAEAFPVTRAEFKKDRQWIENLHKPSRSNN